MKFIILVSNLKEIITQRFLLKKRIYKKLRCNSTVKIGFGRKKILDYAYVLKNGIGRYNICFNFYTKLAESSFLCRLCHVLFFFNKQFRTCANALPNEITVQVVRMYEYCAGKHWIQENKTATYFLRSRLFTYDIMKNFNCNQYKTSNIGNF